MTSPSESTIHDAKPSFQLEDTPIPCPCCGHAVERSHLKMPISIHIPLMSPCPSCNAPLSRTNQITWAMVTLVSSYALAALACHMLKAPSGLIPLGIAVIACLLSTTVVHRLPARTYTANWQSLAVFAGTGPIPPSEHERARTMLAKLEQRVRGGFGIPGQAKPMLEWIATQERRISGS